ncbi:autotransporter-associated beta strand protein [Bradyrhizobium elkanii]|uniref:autotransporter outer membrane beta-barrel domain-containing protein n=1 Tax=Bradyrhizobium TaxID=374 RepID=UPI00216AA7BA|nr:MULTISPECIES: autotransporter domain-containing protein [Bradyrhizobium]MCS3927947.1 autotransporter-associated beta strand protein [Bradyrhizobium elkanii]MCS3968499.1 autotransporter-associated beta strand protein [Bradyrhizobium japonicum]
MSDSIKRANVDTNAPEASATNAARYSDRLRRGEVRAHLVATTAVAALLAATSAHAQDATWLRNPGSGDFNTAGNWNPATVPTGIGTAFFGQSNITSLTFNSGAANSLGGFTFNNAFAGPYSFLLAPLSSLTFTGAGISNFTPNGVQITVSPLSNLVFANNSTAGTSVGTAATTITNGGNVTFAGTSSAGTATIANNFQLLFTNSSTAANATITTNGITTFAGNSTGGNAQLITNAGANLTFEFTAGPNGDNQITAGSIAGAGNYILPGKTLTVGSNDLSTGVSGVIVGAGGSLVKTGSGTLTLSGTNTYTGTTTVNAGSLLVNGSIASSSLTTVNSGAALHGSGTVGPASINAGGFLVPGPVGTPGSINVAGSLAFQSGAFYIVQVSPSTASTTNVTGTASLAGTVGAVFAPGSYVSRQYTILTAAGGLTGTFDALATFGLPAGFGARLAYVGNDAILNLKAQLVPDPNPPIPIPPIPGGPTLPPPPPVFTDNQLNVGRAIDNFFNNGGALPPAFVPLFGLAGSNLTNALDQISGEAATGAQTAAFQLGSQFLNLMLDPLVDGRCGVGRTDYPALGFRPDCEPRPSGPALAYASMYTKAPPAPAPIYEPRWTVWGGGYGGGNKTSGDPVIGSHDLSARTAGFAGGFDYRLAPNSVVGFAIAGGGTNWSLSHGLGGGRSDAVQAGIYGATRWGAAYLAADFAFTNHWMSTDRFAFGGDHLTADFNAQSYGGRLEGGYHFETPYVGVAPYAAIQAQSFHTPSYGEIGTIPNGFALAFGSRDATDTRSELGARFDRSLALYSNAVLTLRGRLAWAHDWVSDPTLMPVFQALPGASFIVNGAIPPKDSALTSVGAELRFVNGISLLAKFDGGFASHSSTYAGTGTIRYSW